MPGIRAMAAPGHTVGHMVFVVASGGKTLVNTGDVAHHHIVSMQNPRAAFAYDTDGAQGVANRLKVLDMLATDRIPIRILSLPLAGARLCGEAGRSLSLRRDADADGAVKTYRKADFPVSEIRRFIEPGPIVWSRRAGRARPTS